MITRLDLMLSALHILGFILLLCNNPIFWSFGLFFTFGFAFIIWNVGGGRFTFFIFWHRRGIPLYGLFP